MLKINANSLFGRGSKTQPITVGGVNALGEDQCNALTLAFLDAADRIRVGDPHVFLRWHENIAPDVKHRAAEMLAAGVSMPLLVNDAPTAQGFINAGVTPEDAWDYCIIGCNELGIPGRSQESATARSGNIVYIKLLNQVLLDHPDVDSLTMDALLDALEALMRETATESHNRGQARKHHVARMMPTPFTSALMHGCIARGQDMQVGMKYHLPGIYERGFTNAVNALAAIQQLVFDERAITSSELVQAMRDDYAGHDALLAKIRHAPKWGNGDARADRWADVLVEMRERVLDAGDAEYGQGPHMQCHVIRSLHYMSGKHMAASPDGRRAGQPLADSIGAEVGTAHAGPTGVLNSVLKLDTPKNYRGGTNLNLTLPSATRNRPEMVDNLQSLVESFFAQGGQELQIASLNADVLRDAQAHPERHGDLVVRIAGFNARFVDLAPVEQEELIERAEAAA
jgi:formate C-acetyltransferase